jgi:hypothetical protein
LAAPAFGEGAFLTAPVFGVTSGFGADSKFTAFSTEVSFLFAFLRAASFCAGGVGTILCAIRPGENNRVSTAEVGAAGASAVNIANGALTFALVCECRRRGGLGASTEGGTVSASLLAMFALIDDTAERGAL